MAQRLNGYEKIMDADAINKAFTSNGNWLFLQNCDDYCTSYLQKQ